MDIIVNEYKNSEKNDLFLLYKYLTSKFWKEDVDLIMYDEINYECEHELHNKRDKQDNFRKQLINKYKKCLISGNGELVCEACHIKPYVLSNDDEKYDINNGLLLDSTHHKLFDRFLISINPETKKLEIKNNLDKEDYKNIWTNNNKIIDIIDKSSIKYLRYHYNLFSK